jgi:membrane-associated PAP2 superfamily phosphatase
MLMLAIRDAQPEDLKWFGLVAAIAVGVILYFARPTGGGKKKRK